MNEKVSESVTGQNQPKPTREERDAAFSSGAGRKAVEVPVPDELKQSHSKKAGAEPIGPPVGTELETQARELEDDI
jgi:hypothetical protein